MRTKIFVILSLITLLLNGCTFNAGIDTMLRPPKLSMEQEQIYNALTERIGTKINLKYPKSGEYLSAFIVANIDDEPSNEAIVFYERTGITTDKSSLRINILDMRGTEWESVYDYSVSAGSEIEKVMISKLGDSDKTSIIVGYSTISQGERELGVYQYAEGVLTNSLSSRYSIMDVIDIDSDQKNELIVVSNKTASQTAQAHMYKMKSNNQYYTDAMAGLNENATDYTQILYGAINESTNAIFIDSIVGTNTIQTEILYPQNGELKKAFVLDPDLLYKTTRPSGYASRDIDGDEVIEIPIPDVFPGYSDLTETERVPMTNWYVCENNILTKKYSGYFSINDGYSFMLPTRWQGQVTIKIDSISEEVIFYKYEGGLSDSIVELMRISVVDKTLSEDKLREGYQIIRTQGDTEYLVHLSTNTQEPLTPTISEVMFNFMFV